MTLLANQSTIKFPLAHTNQSIKFPLIHANNQNQSKNTKMSRKQRAKNIQQLQSIQKFHSLCHPITLFSNQLTSQIPFLSSQSSTHTKLPTHNQNQKKNHKAIHLNIKELTFPELKNQKTQTTTKNKIDAVGKG